MDPFPSPGKSLKCFGKSKNKLKYTVLPRVPKTGGTSYLGALSKVLAIAVKKKKVIKSIKNIHPCQIKRVTKPMKSSMSCEVRFLASIGFKQSFMGTLKPSAQALKALHSGLARANRKAPGKQKVLLLLTV